MNESYNLTAILVGMLKAIPAVVLCFMLVKAIVKIDFSLVKKNKGRLLRYVILITVGLVGLWSVSLICYSLYDGYLHPVVVVITTPFVFLGYVQQIWCNLKTKGLKEGSVVVNKCWMTIFYVLEFLSLSFYPLNTGYIPHVALSLILLLVYGGILQYLVWWTYPESFGMPKEHCKGASWEEFIVDCAMIVIMFFCYKVVENWPGWVFPIGKIN